VALISGAAVSGNPPRQSSRQLLSPWLQGARRNAMAHTLELPDALYAALRRAAAASGTTPIGWIAAHLPDVEEAPETGDEPDAEPKTLADRFAGRLGRIRSGGKERLSEACGARFAEHLEAKRTAGHL
jgi:hypothetical protein